MDVREAAALLDEIAQDGSRSFEIASELRKCSESPCDPVVRTAAAALDYCLTESNEPRRETYGPFCPMLETDLGVTPPYTSDLEHDVLATWEQLAALVQSPVVAARLHDLLWVTRFGETRHEHARAAIDNYIAATELAHCDGLEPFSFLDRAFDLSRELNVPEVAQRVAQRAGEELVAEYKRHEADPRPGVVIRLLTLLVDLPAADRPDDLRKRLDEAHALFAGNYPDDRIALFQLQERLAHGRSRGRSIAFGEQASISGSSGRSSRSAGCCDRMPSCEPLSLRTTPTPRRTCGMRPAAGSRTPIPTIYSCILSRRPSTSRRRRSTSSSGLSSVATGLAPLSIASAGGGLQQGMQRRSPHSRINCWSASSSGSSPLRSCSTTRVAHSATWRLPKRSVIAR